MSEKILTFEIVDPHEETLKMLGRCVIHSKSITIMGGVIYVKKINVECQGSHSYRQKVVEILG